MRTSNNFVVPEGFKLIRDPEIVERERKLEIKKKLEERLKEPKPTDEELISIGKSIHPYYQDQYRLDELNYEGI